MCDLNFLNIERVPVPVMKELRTFVFVRYGEQLVPQKSVLSVSANTLGKW